MFWPTFTPLFLVGNVIVMEGLILVFILGFLVCYFFKHPIKSISLTTKVALVFMVGVFTYFFLFILLAGILTMFIVNNF